MKGLIRKILREETLQVTTRKARTQWSPEATQDLKAFHPDLFELEEGKKTKKDACYHKVKSRYKVWPSAYGSGALVKCRKVGAKNWGNSAPGKTGGWVDCNTCKDGKCKPCGRSEDEKRKKPRCRPTPSACKGFKNEEVITEAEYRGRKVKLNKPTRGDVKKFKVYVKNDKGNVVKVNFGHGGTSAKKRGEKTMRIKKSDPARRKAFRARHNCDNPGPKWKARYWSCRKW